MPRLIAVVTLALLAGYAPRSETPAAREYLYLWTGSSDTTQPDFLAVLDVTPDTGRYGKLVTTVPVPGLRHGPHHTEHEMPAGGRLFANGFESGRTFIFDMSDPAAPTVTAEFGDVAGMSHPHSYLRLPNGNVLITFQMRHNSTGVMPGGLAELGPGGEVVRSSSADLPGVDRQIRPYSAGIVPALDRVVVTTTDMKEDFPASRTVQIWRLSDLTLLRSVALPDGPAGGEGLLSAEPRVLDDGRTVLVSTFNCGLYLLAGLDTDSVSARLVASFPRKDGVNCAIPVIVGHFYLVTVPSQNAVVSLDISNPAAPREAGRVTLGLEDVPHWISVSHDRTRVVVTGYGGMQARVMMLGFDPASGALTVDQRFRDEGATEPGFRMDKQTWPHGNNAAGNPHGAVFSR